MNDVAPGAFTRRIGTRKLNVPLFEGILKTIPKNETVIDIGAGNGKYVQALIDEGYNATGIDGTPNIEEITDGLVHHVDLTKQFYMQHLYVLKVLYSSFLNNRWDWGLFFEVGEHIPKEYESQVFYNVASIPAKKLIVTWGGIGQRGRNHINCHTPVYVASEFAKFHWFVDEKATIAIKECLPTRRSPRERIMVLKST